MNMDEKNPPAEGWQDETPADPKTAEKYDAAEVALDGDEHDAADRAARDEDKTPDADERDDAGDLAVPDDAGVDDADTREAAKGEHKPLEHEDAQQREADALEPGEDSPPESDGPAPIHGEGNTAPGDLDGGPSAEDGPVEPEDGPAPVAWPEGHENADHEPEDGPAPIAGANDDQEAGR